MSEMDLREQELIDRIASELRSGVRFDASFDQRVMAEVRRSGTPIRLSIAGRSNEADRLP